MGFEEACSEMNYILEHLDPKDIDKIPERVREFFKTNKSVLYKVKLDSTKKLEEQELKEETKAFIQILNEKYLFDEKAVKIHKQERIENKQMTIYKENKLLKWIKKVLNIRKIL